MGWEIDRVRLCMLNLKVWELGWRCDECNDCPYSPAKWSNTDAELRVQMSHSVFQVIHTNLCIYALLLPH